MNTDEKNRMDPVALCLSAKVSKKTTVEALQTKIDYFLKAIVEERYEVGISGKKKIIKENIIDSRNMRMKVKKCMKWIKGKDVDDKAKIKLTDFVCNKLSNYYKLPIEHRDAIVVVLTDIVYNGIDLPVPLRLWYLKYKNETVPYQTSIALFKKDVKNVMGEMSYFQILKYVLRSAYKTNPHEILILDKFEELFNNPDTDLYTKMEIADIFLLNNREIRGQEMVNELRDLEYRLVVNNEDAADVQRYNRLNSIYGDSQNVHHTDINTSVMKVCVALFNLEPVGALILTEVTEELNSVATVKQLSSISKVLERIQIDESRFKYIDENKVQTVFSMYDVFTVVWQYICKHKSRKELCLRLVEEIHAMAKYCSTGHVSRFINVIQGYTENEDLCLRISDSTRIKSIITYKLNNLMRKAPDNIQESMIGDEILPFYNYIKLHINNILPKFIEEYGDVQEYVLDAIEKYTRCNEWEILDNILINKEEVKDEVKDEVKYEVKYEIKYVFK